MCVSEDESEEDEDFGFNALRTDRLKKVNISNQGRQLRLKSKAVDLTFHVKTNRAKSKWVVIVAMERLNKSVIGIVDSSPESNY